MSSKIEGKYVKVMVVWCKWAAEAKMVVYGADDGDLKEGC